LVANYQLVGGTNCTESIHNMGAFGEQYDAQVANIQLVPGRNANTFAGKFASNSRFGVFSIGPYTAGMAHSISLWMRTPEASKAMLLLYFGPAWSSTTKDFLQLMLKNGEMHFQFSENDGKFELVEKKMLADNQWHHLAIVMPFKSCRYSQVQLYIDGILCKTQQMRGSDDYIFFHTAGRLSIGSYGYRESKNDDVSLNMFEGEVDDVMVWSKPLQQKDILQIWESESSSPPTPTPGPQDLSSKAIVCGSGNGGCVEGDQKVALIDEIHEVRCCRDCTQCSSPWKRNCPNYNPDIFARSKIGGVCKQGTFLEALDFCSRVTNGRLCTPLEVQNGCAKGTGCQFDREMIWTCAYDGHQCEVDSECCGLCVNGKCDSEHERLQKVRNLNLNHGLGLGVPFQDEGPPLSYAHLNLNIAWILNPISLAAYIYMGVALVS